jgi:glucose/arabinose dehydrogenase
MRATALLLVLLARTAAEASVLPAGFAEETVASGIVRPTAMALAPDGRIFVCQQDGALRIVRDGALLPAPFLTLDVESSGERGLLGVAFDPDFLSNRFLYLYYTAETPTIHNRISRFTAAGDAVVPGSELVLLELPPLIATNHNGGAVHFAGDGTLFAAVGENARRANSQDLASPLGKMLRIRSDGSVPRDNPFFAQTSGASRAVWALGLRNPFTFAIHPRSGRMFINDVGAATWEEVNEGAAGANYGWATTEGPTDDPRFVSPLHFYSSSNTAECAITGGTFYAPDVRQFPAEYFGAYFFSDLCGAWIRRLDDEAAPHDFASEVSNPVDLFTGHDGSLYVLSRAGVVRRIRWSDHLDGDVNADGETDGADVFYLAHHLHSGGPAPLQGGDVNDDGAIDATDLSSLISYLYTR